jgi:Domain of unknown function DUF302
MLQMRAMVGMDQIEPVLKAAAHRHNARVTVVSHLGEPPAKGGGVRRDAVVFSIYHQKLYEELLSADIRFAGFLPCRVAAWPDEEGVTLQAMTPSTYCRILGRADLESKAAPLDEVLRGIIEDAAKPLVATARSRAGVGPSQWGATEDQVNMRAALPQRIDYRGTKVEDEAGTGSHDAPGG